VTDGTPEIVKGGTEPTTAGAEIVMGVALNAKVYQNVYRYAFAGRAELTLIVPVNVAVLALGLRVTSLPHTLLGRFTQYLNEIAPPSRPFEISTSSPLLLVYEFATHTCPEPFPAHV
jgi:hypothetical protein